MYESMVLSSNVGPKRDKKAEEDGENDTERIILICTGLSYS